MSVEVNISDANFERLLEMAVAINCDCTGALLDLIIAKEYKRYQTALNKKKLPETEDGPEETA